MGRTFDANTANKKKLPNVVTSVEKLLQSEGRSHREVKTNPTVVAVVVVEAATGLGGNVGKHPARGSQPGALGAARRPMSKRIQHITLADDVSLT